MTHCPLRQLALHEFAHGTEVEQGGFGAAFEGADDFAHVFLGLSAGRGDGFDDEGFELRGVKGFGQVFFQKGNFDGVGRNEVGPAAFFEFSTRISQVFHGLANGGYGEGVVDRLAGVHGGALDGGVGSAERERGGGIAGFHRGDNVGAESLVNGGHGKGR